MQWFHGDFGLEQPFCCYLVAEIKSVVEKEEKRKKFSFFVCNDKGQREPWERERERGGRVAPVSQRRY